MAHRNGAFVVETLQDHLDTGDDCTLFCRCQRARKIPVTRLVEIFGADFRIVPNRDYFLSRFKCEKCGSRPVTVHFTPGNVPNGW